MKRLLTLTAVASVAATSAFSQVAFSNGDVSLSYSSLEINSSTAVSDVNVSAFGIFEISPSIDIQAGMNYSTLQSGSSNTLSDFGFDLHAIYNLSGGSRLGVFYSSNDVWEYAPFTVNSYGVEYQYFTGPISVEAQVGSTTFFEFDATVAAISAGYAYGDFDFGAGYTYVYSSEFDYAASKLSVSAAYSLASFYDTTLFAEYGYYSSPDFSPTMSEFRVGLSVPFGAGNKNSFTNVGTDLRLLTIYSD